MTMKSVLIIADIEGSTGCAQVNDSRLFTDGWVKACIELSLDLAAVCKALLDKGVPRIRIKDFHRTGFNIFRELLPAQVELDQGYRSGPVIGIGDPTGFDLLMMIGMHAASGTNGFLPHTLTSKFASINVKGKNLTEAELFAASVAPSGLVPVFFSGCQNACDQARSALPELDFFAVNKPLREPPEELRHQLALAAARALGNQAGSVFCPPGPFKATITMRDGEKPAQKLRNRWKFEGAGSQICVSAPSMIELYWKLVKLAYLTPTTATFIEPSLCLANLWGRLALMWARRRSTQFS